MLLVGMLMARARSKTAGRPKCDPHSRIEHSHRGRRSDSQWKDVSMCIPVATAVLLVAVGSLAVPVARAPRQQ